MASLQNADSLQYTPITYFETLLKQNKNFLYLRPTLYDFLAHRAILFLENKEITVENAKDLFLIKDDFYFNNANNFIKKQILTPDTNSVQYNAIKIFRKWLQFRLNNNNKAAFCDVELLRFNFIYKNTNNPNKDSLYINSLQQLYKQNKNIPYSANIAYQISKFYNKLSTKYTPFDTSTYMFKYSNNKALNYLNDAINNYPEYFATTNCLSLKNKNITTSIIF